jgi:hypothetical protein
MGSTETVVPAMAGTQSFRLRVRAAKADALDCRLRGNDEVLEQVT